MSIDLMIASAKMRRKKTVVKKTAGQEQPVRIKKWERERTK